MEQCIICAEKRKDEFSLASEISLNNIKLFSERWARLGKNINIHDRVKQMNIVAGAEYRYHRKCYKSLCNQANLEKAERSHEEDLKCTVNKKRGRPSTSSVPSTPKTRKTFDQELCVFCQGSSVEKLHQVCSEPMGRKFLQIKELSTNEDVRARLALLSDAMDAFAQNCKYHLTCFRKETRHIESFQSTNTCSSENEAIGKAICDIEIVNIVQLIITNSDSFPSIDMKTINNAYIKLLEEHDVTVQRTNFKQHLKSLLLEKIPGIDFVKRGPKPEIVVSQLVKDKILTYEYETSDVDEEMEILSRASKIIRREVDNMKNWQYKGSFDDFETPKKLLQLVRWITYGPHTTLQVKREREAEKTSGSVESVRELRWSLFAQNGKEGRQLPPTLGTLKPHTERAFFMALVWKSSGKPCPNIPPPTNYSWQLQDGNLIPVLSENPPAPKALLELRRCSCSSSCMANRCGCRKNTLVCTDACGCGDGCENSEDYIAEIEEKEELF